jgi:hypothetical protein
MTHHLWKCPRSQVMHPYRNWWQRVEPNPAINATQKILPHVNLRILHHDQPVANLVRRDGEANLRMGGCRELTLEETARMLKISIESVRRLIAQEVLVAQQACTGAPWVIQRAEVDRMVATTNNSSPHTSNSDQISLDLQ